MLNDNRSDLRKMLNRAGKLTPFYPASSFHQIDDKYFNLHLSKLFPREIQDQTRPEWSLNNDMIQPVTLAASRRALVKCHIRIALAHFCHLAVAGLAITG